MVTIVEDLEEHDRRCGGQWLPIEPRGELNMRCARCRAFAAWTCTHDDGQRACMVCGWGTEWDEEEP